MDLTYERYSSHHRNAIAQYKEDTVNSDAVVVNMSMAVNTATGRER